jgi:serine/threonine-protein kinase RsbW
VGGAVEPDGKGVCLDVSDIGGAGVRQGRPVVMPHLPRHDNVKQNRRRLWLNSPEALSTSHNTEFRERIATVLRTVGPSVVEVRVQAVAALVPTIRAVAADLVGRADYDLDSISDLRMAVDEACATLVSVAAADAQLGCRFVIGAHDIEVTVSIPAGHDTEPVDTTGFGWRVLRTLVDNASTYVDVRAEPPQLAIRFVKKARVR